MPSSNDDKKSRYAAALFKNLFERKRKGRQFKKFAAAFEEFQDQLGALDGLTTAMQMLERLYQPAWCLTHGGIPKAEKI
ncbi:CHAD domain-containing protein [Novosphingobium sp. ES2-1]|uniref:CHAD domain-containing protein n=1 Tax=Novosphingobium sp. ES2-1 TaxID=2780074 RepID=UPI00187F070E|nr:CHAD domain-containing protein [Novosphingobium sp. ES2-1]QOV96503.1 CHAD domain-containing protein [Novosphingobium sp. ES2-1]